MLNSLLIYDAKYDPDDKFEREKFSFDNFACLVVRCNGCSLRSCLSCWGITRKGNCAILLFQSSDFGCAVLIGLLLEVLKCKIIVL